MKQIHIESAHDGMELAYNLYDDKDNVLLKSGAKLTDSIINKLRDMGFLTVCVQDENTNDIFIEPCLTNEQKSKAINSLKNLDFKTTKTVDYTNITASAIEIVRSISMKKNISFDLLDIRKDSNYDYRHSLAVAELSIAIAQELRNANGNQIFDSDKLNAIAQSALLHNIGKTCVNPKIAEKIELKEYKEENHPLYGYALLKNAIMPNKAVVSVGVLFQNTNQDKTNCPKGYEEYIKNGVNLYSKIIHVANTYTKLITEKNDEHNIGPAEAVEIIRDSAGKLFDPVIVDTFVRNVAIYPLGSMVTLSNGESAIVIKNNIGGGSGYNYRPVVRTNSGVVYDLLEELSLTIVPNNIENMKVR